MAQIAVTIIDPSDKRSAHLVETQLPIRQLILPIVMRLKLPERATYQLFTLGSENALPTDKSLAEMGVPAGAELQIKPVRNQLLKAILDKLYEEAQGYVEEKVWDLAKAKLDELLRLDPTYPDPLGLEKAVATRTPNLRSVPRAEPFTQRRAQPPLGQRTPAVTTSSATTSTVATSSGTSSTVTTAMPLVTPSGAGAYRLAPEAAKKSGSSCLGITLMVIGVIVVLTLGAAGAYYFLPQLVDNLGRIGLPSFGPTLGTGDVQITLRWEGEADLDLHVIDPAGDEISYVNREVPSGGILDVDANGQCEGVSQPVENVYWPTGAAPQGQYEVFVHYYQTCDSTGPTDYTVTITLDGEVVDEIHAQMTSEGEQHPVTDFDY